MIFSGAVSLLSIAPSSAEPPMAGSCHPAGRTHNRDMMNINFAVERRALAFVFGFCPVNGRQQVLGVCLALLFSFHYSCCQYEETMGSDSAQESALACAVDGAAAISPNHHRQRILPGKCAQVGRAEQDMTGRAESAF
jgi:hypothetical protein